MTAAGDSSGRQATVYAWDLAPGGTRVVTLGPDGQVVREEVVDCFPAAGPWRGSRQPFNSFPSSDLVHAPPASGALTINQLAQHLGVSVRTVRRMVADGEIPYMRVRSEVRFHLPAVVDSLMAGTQTTAAMPPEIDQRSVDGRSGAPSSRRKGRNEEITRRIPIRVPRESEPRDNQTPSQCIGRSEPEGTP